MTKAVSFIALALLVVGGIFPGQSGSAAAGPVRFVENRGQWAESVGFRAEADGVMIWFADDATVYQFVRLAGDETSHAADWQTPVVEQFAMASRLVGASLDSHPTGVDELDAHTNFLRGSDRSQWQLGVPSYSSIVTKAVYPGIDLRYYSSNGRIEYEFIVAPGADPSAIRIQYSGIDSLRVNSSGKLEIATDWGVAIEQAPLIYQTHVTGRREIAGRFSIEADNIFGFELEESFDPNLPLVIDPILVYSTFLGGSDVEQADDIAVDNTGAAYIVGYTLSSDYPVADAYQYFQGSYDVIVTKLNADGDGLVYSTYLGGSDNEWGKSIAVDTEGNAYLTGFTASSDFPTVNPYQSFTNSSDVFVAKLNAAGNDLIYSTWLGGSDNDWGNGIAIDAVGRAYVTGGTRSTDFPTRTPYQLAAAGDDVFVTKLSSSGDELIYSTYLGGSGVDAGAGIAVDPGGNAYVTGHTTSNNFPVSNHYQGHGGFQDAFVTKLNSIGNGLIYSTYLGGSNHDEGLDIAVAGGNYACVTGQTYSSDFPVHLPRHSYRDKGDAFITRFNSVGNSLIFSTPLGGTEIDRGVAIDVDQSGAVYVTGQTYSADFPTHRTRQTYAGAGDLFVTKLPADGSRFVYSTYLGGSDTDEGSGLATVSTTDCLITGRTLSTDFPTLGPYQTDQTNWDAFVTRLDENICCDRRVGDANGLRGDEPTIGDIAIMIDARYISLSCDGLIDCLEEADIDQSGGVEPTCDDITLLDVTILVDYLFITGTSLGLNNCR